MASNPEIDCSYGRLTAPRAPNGLQPATILDEDHSSPPEHGEVTKNGGPSTDIQPLPATAFDHLWGIAKVVKAFAAWVGECQRLLGASLEGNTECENSCNGRGRA